MRMRVFFRALLSKRWKFVWFIGEDFLYGITHRRCRQCHKRKIGALTHAHCFTCQLNDLRRDLEEPGQASS